MATGAGLRPTAKAVERPPDPTVRAPALDPTDVAGVGDGFTAGLMRHSQRKRGVTDRPGLRNTAPALDPTDEREVETEHGGASEAPADERAGN